MQDTRQSEIERIDRMAELLDARYRIPGTPIRFGLDTIVGLIPGVGDIAVAAPSAWMIWRGYKLGVRKRGLVRMGVNTGIDLAVGAIPVLGDLFDLGFKANLRNANILRDELGRPPLVRDVGPTASPPTTTMRPAVRDDAPGRGDGS